MQKPCDNLLRRLVPLMVFVVGSGLFLTGCATSEPIAPQSNLSREQAISMAQRTADTLGGRVFTIAPTGSMKPTLDENSVVAVEKVQFSELRQGDIVIYRDGSGLPIVHRLHQKVDGRWIVLGDNNASVDRETVTSTNLVGRVCAIFYTSQGSSPAVPTAVAHR